MRMEPGVCAPANPEMAPHWPNTWYTQKTAMYADIPLVEFVFVRQGIQHFVLPCMQGESYHR